MVKNSFMIVNLIVFFLWLFNIAMEKSHEKPWSLMRVCLKIGYIPNEIAIFHGDNDQQNHWLFRGTQHFQTNPFTQQFPWLFHWEYTQHFQTNPNEGKPLTTFPPDENPPRFGARLVLLRRHVHVRPKATAAGVAGRDAATLASQPATRWRRRAKGHGKTVEKKAQNRRKLGFWATENGILHPF